MDGPRAGTTNGALGLADRDIVDRIRAGDAELFGRLFDMYWEPLCQVATFSIHDADEAREVVADVFASLWERRTTLTVSSTVAAYLFGATRFRARRAYRDATHRGALLDAHLGEGWEEVSLQGDRIADGDEVASDMDTRLTIEQGLETLPPRYRMAVYLRWQRDLEYDEIAEVLEISREAAKKLVLRAVGMLRERVRGR